MRTAVIALMMVFVSCDHPMKPVEIIDQQEVLVDNEYCRIIHQYPQLTGDFPDTSLIPINSALKNISGITRQVEYCDNYSGDQDSVVLRGIYSGYTVLMMNDSLLSLEYKTTYSINGEKQPTALFHAITLDLESLRFYVAPEAHTNIQREKVWQFVKQFADRNGYSFNENSYAAGSRTILTYALKPDSLIVYPGGEGEFFGYHRVSMPVEMVGH